MANKEDEVKSDERKKGGFIKKRKGKLKIANISIIDFLFKTFEIYL